MATEPAFTESEISKQEAQSKAFLKRELLWATIASKHFHAVTEAFLMPSEKPSPNLPMLLVLETPAGRIVYRLSEDELTSGLFDHLQKRPNDGKPAEDKIGTLWQLAQSCTFSDPAAN